MLGWVVRETIGATPSLPTRGTDEEEIRRGDDCLVFSVRGVSER